jgi:ubiquinone/menaquinone biosynthesis C-methylase UbiE
MNIKQAYEIWSEHYDTTKNKTRDLEAIALRKKLKPIQFNTCLEIGCGTGKNTQWLIERAVEIVAVDFSEKMVAKAIDKVNSDKVSFIIADINQPWNFAKKQFDLIIFSLVLEHIEDLDSIFKQAYRSNKSGGYLYIGELHPFKQYMGSNARFETEEGEQNITCYTHSFSDYTLLAEKNGFELVTINEFFDDNNRKSIPRILTLLFWKK